MVADTDKQAFAQRLNQACDAAGIGAVGRRSTFAAEFGVSRESVRKWLVGDSIPETKRISALANFLGVRGEWLLTGIGQMTDQLQIADTRADYELPANRPQHFDELADIFAALARSDQQRLVDIAKVLAHDYTSPPKTTHSKTKKNVSDIPLSRQGASKR
jgi:phage repressor protein C with HTH and peptisase S24 domain